MRRCQLFLGKHVFVCEQDTQAIFLDVKRDEYSSVSGGELDLLRRVVVGWERCADPLDRNHADDLAAYIRSGVLTTDEKGGKPYAPLQLTEAASSFLTPPWLWPQVTPEQLRRFMAAWATVTLLIKITPLRFMLARVEKRRKEAVSPQMTDAESIRQLVMAYIIMQPLFFSPIDTCLRNSLTLIEFLASYGAYPDLIFGVAVDPFRAHAWVQQGDVVYMDRVEQVKPFKPIMVV